MEGGGQARFHAILDCFSKQHMEIWQQVDVFVFLCIRVICLVWQPDIGPNGMEML